MPTDASSTPAPDAADLLAEAGWLRSLALRLVSDEARADDLVQETWCRALERPPRDRRALPAWLARVARNTAALEQRRAARRRAREARVARPDRMPSAAEVVARTELHRRLVDALLALDEPFRSTLLLRYFDDLTPKEIARRTGVEAATVRTRVKRGLDRLRRRLDETHGGQRRAWILPLVSWARDGGAGAAGASSTLVGGTLAMAASKNIAVLAGVVGVLLVGGSLVVPRLLSNDMRTERNAPVVLEAADGPDDPLLVGRQDPVAGRAPSVADAPSAVLGPWSLDGTVLEIDGQAVADATVGVTLRRGGLADPLGEARTDGAGRFEIDLSSLGVLPPLLRAPAWLEIQAWADGYAPSPEDRVSERLGRRTDLTGLAPALILQPGHVFTGRVLDVHGEPVPGVQVSAVPDGEQARIVARTRPDGSYRGRIPGPGRYAMRAEASGFGTALVSPVDVAAGRDVEVPELVLRGEGFILGVARFPDGAPAAHVGVTASAALPQRLTDEHGLLSSTTTADADGRFALRGLKRGRYALRPRGFRRSEAEPSFETGESAALLIVRHRRVLAEVRDAEGNPVAGTWISGEWIHADGSRDSSAASVGRDGRYAFWVPVGERLLVSADVAGSSYAEVAIDVGETPWDRRVVLTLREASDETGRIRLRVTGDDGSPISEMLATLQTTIAESSLRGLYEVEPDADGLLPPAPVGSWILVLRPGRTKKGMPIELYFPVFERVTVRPGEVTEVEVVARRGGRIRLTLRVPTKGSLTRSDVAIAVARVPSGRPESLGAWVSPNARGWSMGGLDFGAPCIGRTLLRPGAYVLSVEARGHARVEQEVRVAAGEIVDVTVDLETGTSTAAPADAAEDPAAGAEPVALDEVRLGQLQWDDAPLEEILTYLAGKAKVELRVTEKARPLVEEQRIHLQLDDVTVRTWLDLLTAPQNLTWKVVGRTLWIGTGDELLPPR